MRKLLRLACLLSALCLTIVAGPQPVQSQEYLALFREFDGRNLTRDDKRFLQAALAFEGYYNGLLDGQWGKRSQRALEAYSRAEFSTEPADVHMATLAFALVEKFELDGWTRHHFEALDMSLLFPAKTIRLDPPSDSFVNWKHTRSSLSYSVGIHDRKATQRLHDYTTRWHERAAAPYTVRKTNFAVTTARKRDGSILYTRSNFRKGAWSTIMLSVAGQDEPILNAVAASIAPGHAAAIRVTPGGYLDRTIITTLAMLEDEGTAPGTAVAKAPTPDTSSSPDPADRAGTGTGFFVSETGHVLTNAHVVRGCGAITVDGEAATLVTASDDFDLALLRRAPNDDKAIAVFAPGPARLNSDVTVVGYPYGGLLGGLNVTRGAVSSLMGLGGAATQLQITAPVQAGNSGGPVLGPDGAVIGVVVSKLDAAKVADLLGDIPQNVNFAVRGEIAKLFLAQHGVDPRLSDGNVPLTPVELAQQAKGYTAYITCD